MDHQLSFLYIFIYSLQKFLIVASEVAEPHHLAGVYAVPGSETYQVTVEDVLMNLHTPGGRGYISVFNGVNVCAGHFTMPLTARRHS